MTDTTASDTGSWFPVPDESELPSDLQSLFAKARERLGFVPNVFRVYAFRPQPLSAWFSHFRQLHEPTEGLSAADREMIAVVVSSANRRGPRLQQVVSDVASIRPLPGPVPVCGAPAALA
jgi:alkylhydroperoxidase family enzyme